MAGGITFPGGSRVPFDAEVIASGGRGGPRVGGGYFMDFAATGEAGVDAEDVTAALAAHAADTTGIHGIIDTANLRLKDDLVFSGGTATFDDLTIGGVDVPTLIAFNTYYENLQTGHTSAHFGFLPYFTTGGGTIPSYLDFSGVGGQFLQLNGPSTGMQWRTLVTADVTDLLSGSHTWALSQIFSASASFQSGTVPFVVVGTDRVDNLNAEKWDSLGRGTTGQVVLAATGAASVWGQITDSHVDAVAGITWTKISKAGSSIADFATRSAGALNSGNLPYLQLPTGSGSWDTGAGTQITLTRDLRVSGNVGFGTAADANALLMVAKTISGTGTIQYGMFFNPIINTSAAVAGGIGRGAYIRTDVQGGAVVYPTIEGLRIGNPSAPTAGATITTLTGLVIEDQTRGGTNYALRTLGTAQVSFGGAFLAAGLTHIASQTAGTGLVVGSQTVNMSGLGSNVGLDVYADFNATSAGLTFINPNVGTSAGLQMTFGLSDTGNSLKRAGVIRVVKNGTWDATLANQGSDFAFRQYIAGVDSQWMKSRNGIVFLGVASEIFVAASAGDLILSNARSLRGANAANSTTLPMIFVDASDRTNLGLNTLALCLSAPLLQTTVGAAGAASALPATPSKFVVVRDVTGGVDYVAPLYAKV